MLAKYKLSDKAEDEADIRIHIDEYRQEAQAAANAMKVWRYENLKATAHMLGWDRNDCAELKAKFDEAKAKVQAVR